MLPLLSLAFVPVLSLLPSVSAHGFVSKVVIDGTTYTGNVPAALPSDSPIRQISDISPVKGADNSSMNCGLNAQLATMVVPTNPGSDMVFYWADPGNENETVSRVPLPFFNAWALLITDASSAVVAP